MPSEKVFAADLGANSVAAAIVTGEGRIVARKAEALDTSSPDAPLEQLARLARQLAGKTRLRSAAVAINGVVSKDGRVSVPEIAGWTQFPLASRLRQKLRVPVAVESDRAAAVVGETWKGTVPQTENAVVLLLGRTIRAGVMIDGRVHEGAHGCAGGAGWMAVSEADGFEVRKYGGLEAFASGPGIVRAARNAIEAGFGGSLADYDPSLFTAEDIAELARRGDVTARQIYRRAGKQIGLAVANLVCLFDPEAVVLTGGLTASSDLFWTDVLETATTRLRPGAARQVRMCLSEMQGDSVLLGAARAAVRTPVSAGRPPAKRKARAASR